MQCKHQIGMYMYYRLQLISYIVEMAADLLGTVGRDRTCNACPGLDGVQD